MNGCCITCASLRWPVYGAVATLVIGAWDAKHNLAENKRKTLETNSKFEKERQDQRKTDEEYYERRAQENKRNKNIR
jgi:hypothetical protein